MAPNFLSKFVKSSSDHHRSRTNSSARSSTSFVTASTTPSSIVAKPAIAVSPAPPGNNPSTRQSGYSSDSSSPNVTVIPPSPQNSDVSLFDRRSDNSASNQAASTARRAHSLSVGHAPRSPPSTAENAETPEEDPMTPTPWNLTTPSDRSPAVRPSTSTGDLRSQNEQISVAARSHTMAVPPGQLGQSKPRDRTISQKSSRSALKVKVDNIGSAVTKDERTAIPPPLTISPSELTASPETKPDSATITISPIVDSPTNIAPPNSLSPNSNMGPSSMSNIPSSSLLGLPDQSDTVSIYSVGGTKKRRPWSRREKEQTMPALSTSSTFSSITSTSPKSKRKPTAAGGLASALAASGLAMANPAAVMQPMIATESSRTNQSSTTPKSAGHSVTSPASHKRRSSNDRTPKTPPSRASRSRQTSISYATSDVSDRASFYSGDDGEDMISGSEDSDDLDLDTDIPVTGFAVASARRNQEFHDMFGSIPEGDYLIEGMPSCFNINS